MGHPATLVSGCDSNEEDEEWEGRAWARAAPFHAVVRSVPTPAGVANRSPI